MTLPLSKFQDAFLNSLKGKLHQDESLPSIHYQARFAVYRNTSLKGCIAALKENFPTVTEIVGDRWFHHAATVYAKIAPPSDPCLIFYGKDFPEFLERLHLSRDLSYLGDVARLDLMWTASHCAEDGDTSDSATVLIQSAEQPENAVLSIRPYVQWKWFSAQPAYTIWSSIREHTDVPDNLIWKGEGALLHRAGLEVLWQPISLATCAFLNACSTGYSVKHAEQRGLLVDDNFDVSLLLDNLLTTGIFASTALNTRTGAMD